MCDIPVEAKESYCWDAVEINPESNIPAKSIIARYLPVVDWMELAIMTTLGGTTALRL